MTSLLAEPTIPQVLDSADTKPCADASTGRRHDLDALRAIAMLLGIVLHAAISFAPIPWAVSDSQQSESYGVLFACIHGFRMPLFFLLSGFFTAMLWRRRGLGGLIRQRLKRIALPLFIGLFTIIPAMWVVTIYVSRTGASVGDDVSDAVIAGDIDRLRAALEEPQVDVNKLHSGSGASPLSTAVFLDKPEMVAMLIEAGADVNQHNRDNATPLHVAAFMGRDTVAEMLIEAGADTKAIDGTGQTPLEVLRTDFGTTSFIAGQFGMQLDEATLIKNRISIAQRLGAEDFHDTSVARSSGVQGLLTLLFQFPMFMHLWFLWFLCWLILAFIGYTLIVKTLRLERLPRWVVCSPLSLLWLVPLTMLPQSFMASSTFGPDPSIGLLPIPSVFAYYAIFFFVGALYWDMDDQRGRLGRGWKWNLLLALFVVFPLGLDCVAGTFGWFTLIEGSVPRSTLGNFLQALFAWLMIIGSIGFFRSQFSGASSRIRYLSDASYWLYLAHLPLVLLAQWAVRDLRAPAFVKFIGITVAVFGLLLLSYRYGVRYTMIGRLLNGPRRDEAHLETASEGVAFK